MPAEIHAIGNEGLEIVVGGLHVFVDAFYCPVSEVGAAPARSAGDVERADLILVTHSHWDHFDAVQVANVAKRTGATVVGPASVARALRGRLAARQLVELEPPEAKARQPANAQSVDLPAGRVTAFRTFHSRDHNSYLVEQKGFRFFHDGDNEDARRIDRATLGRVDALFIGPWQGSGWVEFIEALRPSRWFLMHLTEEELDEHAAGRFLPDLCDHVPPNLVTLRPGESFPMV